MERNKLSARSPIVRELGAENTKYSNSSKIRCFFYISLQLILILKFCNTKAFFCTNDTPTPIRLAQNSHTIGKWEPGGTAR